MRRVFFLLFLLAGIPVRSAEGVTPEQAQKMAHRFAGMVSRADFAELESVLAPGVVLTSPGLPSRMVGIESFRRYLGANATAFPDLTLTIQEVFVQGDSMIAQWTLTGTHLGSLGAAPPTGRSFGVSGVSVSRVREDKIVEQTDYWDYLGLLLQLGFRVGPPVAPAPATPPASPPHP